MSESWLTPDELAEQMQVHHSTVRRWINSGELSAMRHGRRLRIDPEVAEAFKRAYTVPVEPRPLRPTTPPLRRAASA